MDRTLIDGGGKIPWQVSTKEAEEDADTQALRSSQAASDLPEDRQEMLFNLGLLHKREAKPAQWAVFDSVGKDEVDRIDDLDAPAGLAAVGAAESVKRAMARTCRFPQQETKFPGGRSATAPVHDGPPARIRIAALDRTARGIMGAARSTFVAQGLAPRDMGQRNSPQGRVRSAGYRL